VEEHTSEEVALFVEVRDTGIGIKKEDREKLFESFTRLEEDRNRTIEGTGLGMSIVTCLLDMMGSKLNVESEYGKGSAFSFVIRQKIINDRPIGDYEKQIRLQSAKEAEQEQEHVWAPEARVLVVDDNEMNLKVARNLLKQNGIIPDMERSGSAALETLKKNRYDLVLLDHMMPKMDGIQTLSHIREENLVDDKTVIVALTANAVVGARERYIEAGFDDYLSKPIEIPLLEECLRKYLPAYLVHIKTEEESNGEEKTGNISKEAKENTPEKTTDEEVLEFSAQEEILEFGPGSGDEQGDPVSDTADPFVLIEAMEEYGFNTKEALAFCGGDPGFYHEMLMDFAKDAPERENELDTLLRDEDVQGYQVKVHSLKSAAKTVGDIETSELSLKLENAAKEGNITFIKEHHEKLMSYLKASAAKISGSAK
ncbi:MAG: response regulator, partial [Lachnospiraceae bacterium]|nr:response regulator [Lachnospiraceae bacterium]